MINKSDVIAVVIDIVIDIVIKGVSLADLADEGRALQADLTDKGGAPQAELPDRVLAKEYSSDFYCGAFVYKNKVRVLTRTKYLTLDADS